MMSDRIVIRSNTDNHVMFRVFKAYYSRDSFTFEPYSEHFHAELEINAILSGSGVYHCAGSDYQYQPGDVFMHCGNDLHKFKSIEGGDDLHLVVMQFEPRLIWSPDGWLDSKYMQLFTESSSVCRQVKASSSEAKAIRQLLEKTFDECVERKLAYSMVVEANLLTILANLVRYYSDQMQDNMLQIKPEHIEYIKSSMDYLLSNLDKKLTVEQLAREAQMSKTYYSEMFKALNGISVVNYINNHRIDRAQHMLENTVLSVTAISERCGFNNIANFNRTFKRITGMTPREYRHAMQH